MSDVSDFLEKAPPRLKAGLAKREAVTTEVEQWCQGREIIRTKRIPPLVLNGIIMLPENTIHEIALIVELYLWIFAIDDASDEKWVSLDEFVTLKDKFLSIGQALGARGHDDDPFEAALVSIVRGMVDAVPDYWERDLWTMHLERLMHGMAQEYRWALDYPDKTPSFEALLAETRWSVGFPISAYSAIPLLRAKDSGEIARAVEASGVAIRLCNDIKSMHREIDEGTINSVALWAAEKNVSTAVAREYVLGRIAAAAQTAQAALTGQTPIPVRRMILDTVHFSRVFYAETDYHLFEIY